MNRETLSHYGWIVILTLVLSVLMAFATPFGTYVGDGVVAIGQTFVKTAVNSTDEGNVSKLENEIDEKFKGCNHTNVDIVNKVEPACGVDGYSGDTVCRKCGKVLKEGVLTKSREHDFTHYMKFSDNQHKRVCNNCDYEELSDHRLNYVETVKSTCITQGSSDVDCKDCQYTGVRPNALIPSNHEGRSINGGTQGVHSKYSCCGVTIGTTHTYTKTTKIAATCTVKGTSTYTCSCGYKYDSQDIAALGHDFTKKDTSTTYRVTTATCQKLATYNYRCTRCTTRDTTRTFEAGSLAAHDYNEQSATSTYLATSATCLKKATYYYKCIWCTAKGTTTYESGSATGHSYTANGTTLATAATCTTNKFCYKECQWCGLDTTTKYEVANSKNPSNHTGTSTYGGTSGVHTKYTCCGATISSTHTYDKDSGVQYTAATCTAKRKNYKSCACGYNPKSSSYTIETGSVNASNHTGSATYGGTSGVHTKYSCCGATISSSHTYDKDSGVQYTAATCIAKRKNYKSCACGYNPKNSSYVVETGSVNASNHSGSSIYGGTSGVHTKYSCCGVTISSTHTYNKDSGVQYTEATCVAKRKNYKSCACGYNPKNSSYTVETGSLNASNHTKTTRHYGGTYANHSAWDCCNAVAYTHDSSASNYYASYTSSVQTAATCTTKGTTKYTCTCGYYYTSQNIAINSSNHSWNSGSVTTAATCTSTGVKTYTCTRSSSHTKTETIAKNPSNHSKTTRHYGGTYANHSAWDCCNAVAYTHDSSASNYYASYTSSVQTAATCTTKGTTKYTCTCGYYYTSQNIAINSSNHSWNSGSVTKAATCTATGTKTYTCTRNSSHTKTETIAKNASNHSGSSVYGGTSGVHTKYNCCGATISASHSYSTSVSGTCVDGIKTTKTCACGYSTSSTSSGTCSFTVQCNTRHTHGKTGSQMGGHFASNTSHKYFRHRMCVTCGGRQKSVNCADCNSPTPVVTCKCTNHAANKVRCSKSTWCRYAHTGSKYETVTEW